MTSNTDADDRWVKETRPVRPMRYRMEPGQAKFWPPKPSRFWATLLEPLRHLYARRMWGMGEVDVAGTERTFARVGPTDGVLLAPNHSFDADAYCMMQLARHVRRQFFFMAAYHVFNARGGIDGWVMQRLGAFSIDREGVDRRAMRTASDLLSSGNCLVLFPEGEVYRLNERLTPILEGPAFIAAAAQRTCDDVGGGRRVWVVPTAIHYAQSRDIGGELATAMTRLETRMFWSRPPAGAALHDRIVRFGEMLLTLKEKEKLGRSCEGEADLPTRIARLIESLLARHEQEYIQKSPAADSVPLRVKALRRCLLDRWTDETADPAARRSAGDALDDVQLVLQLFSYPGDYVAQRPTPERMAETIEKFEQDVFGRVRPIGRRRAKVVLGDPIDMAGQVRSGNRRTMVADLTEQLERTIEQLVRR